MGKGYGNEWRKNRKCGRDMGWNRNRKGKKDMKRIVIGV